MAWLDTVRVLASLLVLISHFCYAFNFERLQFIRNYFAGSTGCIGVSLFFAISGYLVCWSLAKGDGIWKFYKSKVVRIWLPFVASWLFLSALFFGLSFLRPDIMKLTPFRHVFFVGGSYTAFLVGMIPLDGYLNQFILHWHGYWLVGEWFIGTLVSMYVVSPLLYVLAKRLPLLGLAGLLGVSTWIYSEAADWWVHGFWFFLVRTPEFYVGILLCMYREQISRWGNRWLWGTFAVMMVVFVADLFLYNDAVIGKRFIPTEPRSFLFSLPMIAFAFAGLARVNERWDLSFFNCYSKISYTFMLIQHVVINTFFWQFKATSLSKLGALVGLLVVLAVTVYLAKKITACYKPVEEWLMRVVVGK